MTIPPNRHVKHKDGWEVNMYFSPVLLAQLDSRDHETREDARRAVCTRFGRSCLTKYGADWPGYWVYWQDLVITQVKRPPRPKLPSSTEDMRPPCRCDTPFRCPRHDP